MLLMYRIFVWLFLFVGQTALTQVAAQESFDIRIERNYRGEDCTSGYLSVNGTVKMYAIELPWKNNQPDISSVPVGKYKGILRYDHQDAWRIELVGVPNRKNVQIHVGNYVADSQGCVLVGADVDVDKLCVVKNSKKAYSQLKSLFYGSENPNATPNKLITVEFVK